ncbi:MAG: hypothetical protein PUP92_38975 [Rhizonema sp. PD38]|nr:hypothetical protein [Rhizonema sp. PD38]
MKRYQAGECQKQLVVALSSYWLAASQERRGYLEHVYANYKLTIAELH